MDQVLPGYPEEYRYLHSDDAPTMINLHKDRPSPTTIESRSNHGNNQEGVPFAEDLENVSLYYGSNNKSNSNNNNNNNNSNNNNTNNSNKNNGKNSTDNVSISTVSDLEEGARRKLRRERNKVAASKCRNKRKEHIRYLMKESDDLETKNSLLQKEVFLLQSEIKELECMLDTHRCIMKGEINR